MLTMHVLRACYVQSVCFASDQKSLNEINLLREPAFMHTLAAACCQTHISHSSLQQRIMSSINCKQVAVSK